LVIELHRRDGTSCRNFTRSKDDPAAADPATPLLSLRWTFSAALNEKEPGA
jgi:hypothetical protein